MIIYIFYQGQVFCEPCLLKRQFRKSESAEVSTIVWKIYFEELSKKSPTRGKIQKCTRLQGVHRVHSGSSSKST